MVKKQGFVTWIQALHCFIVYVRTDDIYKDIAEDVDRRSDTSNYELNRPLPEENKQNGYRFKER